uniref:NPH3 domain-containing protein n=1 Tax=Oryza brachyantha TaxID=4533 RepID=J3LYW6_ORYBR
MKLMTLGSRPDTFFSAGPARSVSTEVATDMQILVDGCLFRLHKFPLLSKCMWLQALCVESGHGGGAVELPAFPGGAEAFEACAKFCYGIAVTIGPHNVVAVRCAAARLGMTEAADRGNLAAKLDAFVSSCLLRRWKDALTVLHSTRRYVALCEELGFTSRCVDAVASLIADPDGNASGAVPASSSSPWWARDISELGIDLYWRVMVVVRAAGTVHGKTMGDALKTYARRWRPIAAKNHYAAERTDGSVANAERAAKIHRLLIEKIVSLLPEGRGAVSCGFLLQLLKAANILGASPASKAELTRRVASQLEDANVSDLLIPAAAPCASGTLYDVESVVAILEEFALRQAAAAAAAGSPDGSPALANRHRRSRSAESAVEFEGARRSTSMAAAAHGAMVRVGRLVDGFLAVLAKDARTPLDKMVAVAEAVPDYARPEHDDLYRAIDTYLRMHPEMDKSSRKKLCRVLNCRKLSEKSSMHAAQNELLPLRVVVQGLRRAASRVATLKMRLEEDDDEDDAGAGDEAFVHRAPAGVARSASSRFTAAGKPKRMLSRLWPRSRTFT